MSLFSLCLDFVASNVHLVESFCGFPDSIGRIIFTESARKAIFRNIKGCEKAKLSLKVFFDAYGELGILTSLCLHQSHLFVNDALSICPWVLKDVTALDLSSCGLGDSHELLPEITSCLRLETVNLQANCLTDNGIRVLTAPFRFQRKTHCLKYINLSSNKITVKSLQFLKIFPALSVIDASNTCINGQMDSLRSMTNFTLHNTCSCCDSLCQTTTEGWAKDVMESWKQEYKNHTSCTLKPSSPITSLTNFPQEAITIGAASFYSRKKCVPLSRSSHPHTETGSKGDVEGVTNNKLILTTKSFHCSTEKYHHSSVCRYKDNFESQTSPSSSQSPLGNVLAYYVDKSEENPWQVAPCPGERSSSSSIIVSGQSNRRLKRKTNSNDGTITKNTKHRKKTCFMKDKKIGIIAPDNFQKAKKDDTSHSPLVVSGFETNDLLHFYSDSVDDHSLGNGNQRKVSKPCERNLVDELEQMF